jgi:hypothetical protein
VRITVCSDIAMLERWFNIALEAKAVSEALA